MTPVEFAARSQEERAEKADRAAAEALSMLDIFDASSVGLGFVDSDFRFIRINAALASTNDRTAAEHIGRTVEEVVPEIWPQLQPMYQRVIETGETISNVEVAGSTAADPGRIHHWLTSLYPVRVDGIVVGVGNVTVDVTERKELEQNLHDQALLDGLTGLPNRARLTEAGTVVLESASGRFLTTTVLYVDLDNFKAINDGLGHGAGDRLLTAVAQRMAGVMREEDLLCRVGGDEFVVLLGPGCSESSAEVISERVLASLRTPFELDGHAVYITASIGIATGRNCAIEQIVRDADIAMCQAKTAGKNATVRFLPQMQMLAEERLQLAFDMKAAISKAEFSVLYQPIVSLPDCSIIGAEALVRWDHPTRGRIMPSEFIPLAEENGMVIDIGRTVLRQACEQAVLWQTSSRELSLAVNVSMRQLDSPGLVDDVRLILKETGLDPSLLVLEVTETVMMRDLDHVAEALTALKCLGVRLAVDDFGTGYSSLSSLRRFPVDILKIDQSFVAGLQESPAQVAIVRSLIELGRALGLQILAEGVELESQLRVLTREHCDTAQGYLFAHPLDVASFSRFIARGVQPLRRDLARSA